MLGADALFVKPLLRGNAAAALRDLGDQIDARAATPRAPYAGGSPIRTIRRGRLVAGK
jgi:hypothetical protein